MAQTEVGGNEFLSANQVSYVLGVKKSYLNKAMAENRIPSVVLPGSRIRRVHLTSLAEWLETNGGSFPDWPQRLAKIRESIRTANEVDAFDNVFKGSPPLGK